MEEGKKKEGFFKQLGKDLRLQVGFFVVSMVMLVAIYFPIYTLLNKNLLLQEIQRKPQEIDLTLYTNIESSLSKSGKTNLRGWILKKDARLIDAVVVLRDEEEKLISVKNTGEECALDYSEYLGIDDTSKGFDFIGDIKLEKDVCYEVLLYVRYEIHDGVSEEIVTKKVNTNQYLFNGNVYTYNPLEYESPQFIDDCVQKLVSEGRVCGHDKKNGAWVFYLENKLLWVLDKKIPQNNAEDVCIYLHFLTANNINLSIERQEFGFDNYDFLFCENEVVLEDNSEYRVAVMDIPVEYPITYMGTGHYIIQEGKNNWELIYRFQKGQ